MLLHNDVERGDDLLFTLKLHLKITKDKKIHEINMKKAQIEKRLYCFLSVKLKWKACQKHKMESLPQLWYEL